LVGMTRAQITDAAFANKAMSGRAYDIRPCVFDNSAWGEVYQGKPVAEFHNPHLGEEGEATWQPKPVNKPRHIVVVGAGVSGLETAWVAAARGHKVTLFGASERVGGSLIKESLLPGRSEMAKVIDYQRILAEQHGVEFLLGKKVNSVEVAAMDPDVVVLATGADLRVPETLKISADASIPLVSARDYASDNLPEIAGTKLAVLFDQDHGPATYGVADKLAKFFERVILVTPRPHIAQRVNHCSSIGIYRRLYDAHVEIVTAHEPVLIEKNRLVCRNVYVDRVSNFDDVDLLVYSTPRTAIDNLAFEINKCEIHLVGDCQSPRDLLAAVHGGHQVGNFV